MNRSLVLIPLTLALLGAGCSLTPSVQDGGTFRSDDAGSTWVQKVFVRQEAKRTVRIDGMNARGFRTDADGKLYLITRENGVWWTQDHGEHWVQLGLTASPLDFTVDPDSSSILYAAVGQGIQRSADAGVSWRTVYSAPRPTETIVGIAVNPVDPTHLLSVTSVGSTVESRDSGATWTVRSFQTFGFTQLVADPQSARILYAVTTTGPVKSVDGGTTWASLQAAITAAMPKAGAVNQIVLEPGNPSTVYLATNGGLLISTDAAATFARVPTLIPAGTPVSLLTVRDSRTILFVTNNRLQRTDDGGRTWSTPRIPTGRALVALTFDPVQRSTVFAGTLRPTKR